MTEACELVLVLWMATFTYTTKTWGLTKSVTHKGGDHFGMQNQGVCVCHVLQTVSVQYYNSFLQYNLYCTVKDKHPNWLKISSILHDNVAAHSVLLVFLALRVGGWGGGMLKQCPYFSNLSPCDYHCISRLMQPLHGMWFSNGIF